MARGHKRVARRSLTPEEWLRLRVKEMDRWLVAASAPTGRWQVRQADYRGPGDYRWLGRWRRIREGERFGQPDGTFFFRSTLTVPDKLAGLPVALELATPTEVMVRLDGELVNAFDPNRSRVPLADPAAGGESFACLLEAYMRSAPDDMRVRGGPGWGCVQPFRPPRFVCPDRVVEQFHTDVTTALEVALCRETDEEVRELLLHRLDETLKLLDRDTDDRRAYHKSVARARAYLHEHIYERTDLAGPGRLALVGHSHVDVAYHWRVKQGIRKNARTAAVQLALLGEHPEMLYCHSQPYLYEQLAQHWPDLYARVKQAVADGRWELVGATYVEPDCNVPSAESLIRQCLYGQLFYLREFGRTVDTCWLPDVFGNSWVMPQILAGAGIRYFVSNKMSTWNDTNRFPHTNFRWRGVDGTEVLACVPASHFNCWLAPDQLLANWEGFAEKVEVGESMCMFGFGDGGGGLTRELLEAARRLEAFPGLPRTRTVTAKTYLDEAFADPDSLAVWDDELYLEMHRGTTTTKARLKQLNRRCELTARAAELWNVLAEPYGRDIPTERLEQGWKQILVNQFHDILPGSHTTPVGREAEETYEETYRDLGEAMAGAAGQIAMNISMAAESRSVTVNVFNSLAWPVSGPVTAMPAEEGMH
ncbi:MAG: alpha-mannosidase, partial [Planctomycetota bacterium]